MTQQKILKILKSIYKFLASRKFSVFSMFLLIALLIVWLIPFQVYGVPKWRINNIANNTWFFRLGYALVLINLLFCMIDAFPRVKRRIAAFPFIPSTPEDLGEETTLQKITSNLDKAQVIDELQQISLLKGFKSKINQDKSCLVAYKGRWSLLGNLFFHLSLFLLVIGILVSGITGFEGEAVVTEGQTFSSENNSLFVFPDQKKIASMRGRIPDITFQVDNVQPEFWADKFLFTNLEAELGYGADLENFAKIRLNSPLIYDGSVVAIKGFGYAPHVNIKDKDGQILLDSFVNMAVFPSGKEDYFVIPDLNYEVHVILWSDHYWQNNQIKNKTNNLLNPLFTVYILKDKQNIDKETKDPMKNKVAVYQGNLKPGQEANFEGYTISFPEIHYYGEFRIISAPGVVIIFIGFIIALIGLVLRLVFYRQELFFMIKNNSVIEIYLGGYSDYYKQSFNRNLGNLAKEINQILKKAE